MRAMRLAVGLVVLGLVFTVLGLYGVVDGIGWVGLGTLALGALFAIALTLAGGMRDDGRMRRGRQT